MSVTTYASKSNAIRAAKRQGYTIDQVNIAQNAAGTWYFAEKVIEPAKPTKRVSMRWSVLYLIKPDTGITADEIGAVLGLTRNQVKSHLEVLRVRDEVKIIHTMSKRVATYRLAS